MQSSQSETTCTAIRIGDHIYFDIPCPQPFLYRGSPYPSQEKDILYPRPSDKPQDQGKPYIFASESKAYAAAYGMTYNSPSLYSQIEIGGRSVPFVFLGILQNPWSFYQDFSRRVSYVQSLPSQGFWASYPANVCQHENGRDLPPKDCRAFEWLSPTPVQITQKVEIIPLPTLLSMGVQLFTGSLETLSALAQSRDAGNPNLIAKWVEAGRLNWENLRADYDAEPNAREACLMERLERRLDHVTDHVKLRRYQKALQKGQPSLL